MSLTAVKTESCDDELDIQNLNSEHTHLRKDSMDERRSLIKEVDDFSIKPEQELNTQIKRECIMTDDFVTKTEGETFEVPIKQELNVADDLFVRPEQETFDVAIKREHFAADDIVVRADRGTDETVVKGESCSMLRPLLPLKQAKVSFGDGTGSREDVATESCCPTPVRTELGVVVKEEHREGSTSSTSSIPDDKRAGSKSMSCYHSETDGSKAEEDTPIGEEQFECDDCGYTTMKIFMFLHHIRTHEDLKWTRTTQEMGDAMFETYSNQNTSELRCLVSARAAERSRLYRERHKDKINERRRETRHRRQYSHQAHTVCEAEDAVEIEQITQATLNDRLTPNLHAERQKLCYEERKEGIVNAHTIWAHTTQDTDDDIITENNINTCYLRRIVPVRVDSKAAERSRLYRERHKDRINERRREVRQRRQHLQRLGAESEARDAADTEMSARATSNDQLSSSSHAQRQRRYYERHKEEINKRKNKRRRENRLKSRSSKPAPASGAERSRKYRERNRREINERRRGCRLLQQIVKGTDAGCDIKI